MIPKFDCFHHSLHSDFLLFEPYRAFLCQQGFTGYLHVGNDAVELFHFFKKGRDIHSFCLTDGKLTLLDNLTETVASMDEYALSSFYCPEGIVEYFSRLHSTKRMLNGLALDGVGGISDLIFQLEEKKVTGYLEAVKTGVVPRYIYFYNGKILGYLNIKNPDGVFEQGLDRAVVQAALAHTTVNVYRFSSPAKKGKAAASTFNSSLNEGASLQKEAPSPDLRSEQRRQVELCFEKIMAHLEREIRLGDFDVIWRNCAMELSAEYPFLNPFAGEFQYRNGKIDLWEKIDTPAAAAALDALVNAIAKQSSLPKDGIKSLKSSFKDILANYEIKN